MAWMLAMKAKNMVLIGEAVGADAMRMPDGAIIDVRDVKHFIIEHRDNACAHYWGMRKCVFPGYVNALSNLANMERKIGGQANFVSHKRTSSSWGEGRLWYRQGRDARVRGEDIASCPYPAAIAPEAHASWCAGWHGTNASNSASVTRREIPAAGADVVLPSGYTAAQEPIARAIVDDGRAAYLLGKPIDACPYEPSTAEGACWLTGYETQEAG